jgi:5'-phosphate synthase pdxT subunit
LKLLASTGLDEAIRAHAERGGAILGTCAGAILLASEVSHPAQPSLALLHASVERNAYGRQVDSFIDVAEPTAAGRRELGAEPIPAVFIRAPRLLDVGSGVEVLATHGRDPVLVRQGSVLASTFHPELTQDRRVHGLFADACRSVAPSP